MAENIVIKFTADTSGLQSSVDLLEQMNLIDKKLAEDFKKLNAEIKTFGTTATEAAKTTVTSTAAVAANTEKTVVATKSLRAELRAATQEAARLSQEFGELSPQALEASQRAAKLADTLQDTQRNIKALDPDRKLGAFITLGNSATGAIQALAGGMQLLGLKSEEAAKAGQVLQGAFNVVSGIQSVSQLREAFVGLRVSILAGTAAQGGLTAATKTFIATSGPLIAIVAALAGAYALVSINLEKAERAQELFNKKLADGRAAEDTFAKEFIKIREERLALLDFEIEKAQALGKSEAFLLKLRIERAQAELRANQAALSSGKANVQFMDEIIARNRQILRDIELLEIRYDSLNKQLSGSEAKEAIESIKTLAISIEDIPTAAEKALEVIDEIKRTASEIEPVKFITPAESDEFKKRAALYIGQANEVASTIFDINNQYREEEEIQLEEQLQRRQISEEQYERKLKAIKTDAAKKNKEQALFNATLLGAQAILNAATTPPPGTAAAIAFASVLTALKLTQIASAQVPRFNDGTLSVPGHDMGHDSVLAMLRPGEAVMPVGTSKAYRPTLAAMYNGMISPSDLNAFVSSKMNGGSVHATINPYDIKRAFSGGIDVKNADYIAGKIAQAVTGDSIETKVLNRRLN
jgi:hypothetical protein